MPCHEGERVKKEKPKIAVLGWGSLLWEPGNDFDNWVEPWEKDGPTLPIEFSRVSASRNGALTLVIDSKHGSPTTVAWCISKRAEIDDAVADLRCREGTNLSNIGLIRPSENRATPDEVQRAIIDWALAKKLDAVVWTALKSNFQDKVNKPFSTSNAVSYIKTLSVEGKARAAEYVWKAPEFVRTPLRSTLQGEPWFSQQ
jgi:hypothetical protein